MVAMLLLWALPLLLPGAAAQEQVLVSKEPNQMFFDSSNFVAADLELRRSAAGTYFHPEGTSSYVDISKEESNSILEVYLQNPIEHNCMLVRDLATPFRQGQALNLEDAPLTRLRQRAGQNGTVDSEAPEAPKKEKPKGGSQANAKLKATFRFPADHLLPKGAVMDRSSDRNEGGLVHTSDAELQLSMFAFLTSVVGEVVVIGNGVIRKWSSKKSVPVAGFLCNARNSVKVLHTLPTPCLATSLDMQGGRITPQSTNTDELTMQVAAAPAAAEPGKDRYEVWVGNDRLSFSSKNRANRFCERLATEISLDRDDSRWGVRAPEDRDAPLHDLTVAEYRRMFREPTPRLSLGTKSLLVVVMDWKEHDHSKPPYTSQTLTPDHYLKNVFPVVKETFLNASLGQLNLQVTVLPEVIRFTRPRSRYTAGGYPFPGLYDGARVSLMGNAKWGSMVSFDAYDLVVVITPQQGPAGTKGVSWLGAKGALCNGCEALSTRLQIHVAVHEISHNLGLAHANSALMEYGNTMDWMGNFPHPANLLHFGPNSRILMGWLPHTSVALVTEKDLAIEGMSREYVLRPAQNTTVPSEGELVTIRIRLKGTRRDLFASYRADVAGKAAPVGVLLHWYDRYRPRSEIIDAACHSLSLRDAALQKNWTYVDPSERVVIHVKDITADFAVLRIYGMPASPSSRAQLKARVNYTDGHSKCPLSCQDMDISYSMYSNCNKLAEDGYCQNDELMLGGESRVIWKDICPQSCMMCAKALSAQKAKIQTSECRDRSIKVNGMTCIDLASKGMCGYVTNLGHIGSILCPASCDKCSPKTTVNSTAAITSGEVFTDPEPAERFGLKTSDVPQVFDSIEAMQAERVKDEINEEARGKIEEARLEAYEVCNDDIAWTDFDGDGCDTYKAKIAEGKMSVEQACSYNSGLAKSHCRKSCKTCTVTADTCRDKSCVTSLLERFGRCLSCGDWPSKCNEAAFRSDCPRTCGTCPVSSESLQPPVKGNLTTTSAITCEDHSCVDAWLESTGNCYKCKDFAKEFCGRDEEFRQACPRSCNICRSGEGRDKCKDDFLSHNCNRLVEWGRCGDPDVTEHCKASCGFCKKPVRSDDNEQSAATAQAARPWILLAALGLARGL